MAQIDFARLQEIAKKVDTLQQGQLLGKFNPGRIPKITFPSAPLSCSAFETAVSPDCTYRLISAALEEAKHTLLVYVYEIHAEYMVDLVKQAHAKGAKIRLMYDRGGTHADERDVLDALDDTGFEIKPAPSSGGRGVFTVCHQKFVVIDGKTVVVESANWAETSIPLIENGDPFKKGNREWMIRMDDADIAKFFTTVFDADWNIPDLGGPAGLVSVDEDDVAESLMVPAELVGHPKKMFDIDEFNSATNVMPIFSPDNYFDVISALLEKAEKSIILQQQYVLAGDKVDDLLQIVADRREKGVDVRIMASATFPKNWNLTVETLDAVGLKDCLKALNLKFFTHLHNKGVIVDRNHVAVSSTNWSANSITKAREAGVLLTSKPIAEYYAGVFDEDWDEGIPADDVKKKLVEISGGRLV
ncbi:phospholipase D-like domain-containing protein [Bradyrhizobium sp. SZCCHNS1054]|uniref:phospholipase D-like domain-containing protein n=1 Tax=Bradyrhizobium sp. SZCCHNS1054 TaxID=3057301 RepID=UPI002916BF71|nr:phospholipase D-like domain-containing protein [Bradyrhizobium sp. SZCCHNS1054]